MSSPARLPDLNPVDFILLGALKARVFHYFKPNNIGSLKQRIIEVWNDVTIDELTRAVHNLETRVKLLIEENGANIEQLL